MNIRSLYTILRSDGASTETQLIQLIDAAYFAACRGELLGRVKYLTEVETLVSKDEEK